NGPDHPGLPGLVAGRLVVTASSVKPSTIAVLGGYGTFGARVSRDLADRGHRVVVAGRDGRRAEALARALGPEHGGVAADVRDLAACRQAIRRAVVVV